MPEPIEHTTRPWLLERARRDPDALAVRCGEEAVSFGALQTRVERLAARLAALGLRPGDRLAIVAGSSLAAVELVHAAQRLAATLVAVNARLAPVEIAALFDDAAPRLVVHDEAHAELVRRAGARVPVVEAASIARRPAPEPPPPPALRPDDVHTILYTSGTTGRPKGAMLTHGNHLASALASRRRLGIAPSDRWLAMLPLHHVGGLSILLRGVLDGVPVLLHQRFDAGAANRAIREEGASLVSVVATMLRRMLDANGAAPYPASLRAVLAGGGPIPEVLVRDALGAGVPVMPTYGLTEAASQVATASPDEARAHPQAAGRPLTGTLVRIREPDAEGRGEILVRGPTVMAGYFRNPEATSATLRDGWLHTGDVGHLDAEGRLVVHDRRSDLVVSGGENVYPAEVEAVLLAHPAVAEAAAYGAPDPEWGRRVAAAVVLREGASVGEKALSEWCAERLAGYKRPRELRFVRELPRTASGKVRRGQVLNRESLDGSLPFGERFDSRFKT